MKAPKIIINYSFQVTDDTEEFSLNFSNSSQQLSLEELVTYGMYTLDGINSFKNCMFIVKKIFISPPGGLSEEEVATEVEFVQDNAELFNNENFNEKSKADAESTSNAQLDLFEIVPGTPKEKAMMKPTRKFITEKLMNNKISTQNFSGEHISIIYFI